MQAAGQMELSDSPSPKRIANLLEQLFLLYSGTPEQQPPLGASRLAFVKRGWPFCSGFLCSIPESFVYFNTWMVVIKNGIY